ncbi:YfbK domain-containing protein [Ulvibacterium marinum]|uniref:YfbK domain-containing protein n=1 Tax=Ulvibacterium marinum TaxID=2419782 RepID=UPI002494494B|nr:von Willebrand factor type A domain-containing protein [Ulvibacterium marinum]
MKNLVVLLVITLTAISSHAQTMQITGTVSDSNSPLPGVNVLVKGTTIGTQTDFDGNYQITASKGDILVFNYIGFKTKEVKVIDSFVINVTLQEDIQALEEVVVVGYATQQKRSMTHSISSISSESIRSITQQNLVRQLQGKAAGVSITNTANLSKKQRLTLKGLVGQKENREPLYIVDGTPIAQNNNPIIEKINPNEIEKKNSYKPGRAQRMFGSIAKNGCIVITTKKGNYQIENDESYAKINENKFEQVLLSPLSTFSIDVDKASYSNIRRMLNNGQTVKPGAVKIEEMINYFDYEYTQPKTYHPFAIHTEVAKTPWNNTTKLVRIGLQGKTYTNTELPPSNLTFLIDVSGSMNSPKKLPLLKNAFKLLVNQLRKKDKVAIVVYAGAAGVVLKPTSGADKETILAALDNLEAGGSTAGGEGIELAYHIARKNFKRSGNNRVILATDGDFNVGASSDDAMEDLIEEKRKSGVFLSVLGFGMGNYKDSKLEILADKGNGNHAYIDTMQEAQKVFGKEFGGTLHTIAKDVKIQIEFNPAKVQSYRLIGYENRMLAAEDFVDDTKDAGELGSGHKVTALYEIIPIGIENNYTDNHIDLKYAEKKNKTAFSEELLTVKFRYKKPSGDKSIEIVNVVENLENDMSTDFTFASAVALFGMHLRNSNYTNNSGLDDVIELAEKARGVDSNGYRSEFIRLVKTYHNSL